jgi:hypothetical protein
MSLCRLLCSKKISASQGVAVRPEVDMSIHNMFRQDVEVVGARLGDLVSLSIQITVDHGEREVLPLYKLFRDGSGSVSNDPRCL